MCLIFKRPIYDFLVICGFGLLYEAATFVDSGDKALKFLGLLDDDLDNSSSTSSESLQLNVIIFLITPSLISLCWVFLDVVIYCILAKLLLITL